MSEPARGASRCATPPAILAQVRIASPLGTRGQRPGPLDVYFRGLAGAPLERAEQTFFAGLQLSNGTYKTTSAGRLEDLNRAVAPLLRRDRPLQIMDTAISSGVTTLEWIEDLNRAGIEHRMVAGDLVIHGVIARVGRQSAVLWQEGGHPLAIQLGSRSIYLTRGNPITGYVAPVLRRLYPGRVAGNPPGERARPNGSGPHTQVIALVTNSLTGTPEIEIVQDDISKPGRFIGRFDVCRAANVLNRNYFSDAEIVIMARNLVERVRDGGLLVLCRTSDEDHINRASIVRRESGSVRVVERLGGGIEVEDLVLRAVQAVSVGA